MTILSQKTPRKDKTGAFCRTDLLEGVNYLRIAGRSWAAVAHA
jgi:hypothetical protein